MISTHVMSQSIAPAFRRIPHRDPDVNRTVRIAANVSMPLQVQASIREAGPGAPLGAKLTLEGAIVLPGVSAMLTFAKKDDNRDNGSLASEAILIPPGEWFVAASSSPPLRITRNSPLQIQIRDSSGAPLAEACNLGRQEDGEPREFGLSVRVPATLVAEITTDGRYSTRCTTIGGKLVFGRGILIRCMFGEGGEAWGSHLCGVGKVDIVAVEVGQTILFPDQLVEPSARDVSLQRMLFRDGQGYPFSSNGLYSA
ncbi:MAG TPA: hypothetical protein VER77_05100 [Candidatus Dormibacteraeota bacterium]|nr:hypothetical protein [Candidatus Dormibacteraeota bacterium]